MKSPLPSPSICDAPRTAALSILALCILLMGAVHTQSQITVKVDSTKNWAGFMNWFSTNDVYVSGGTWGLADLRGAFLPFQTNATTVVLKANTNTFNTNGYWNLQDGTPNKHLEANFYVDVGTAFAGNDVTFEGTVISNTLPSGWTCYAVVKQFAAGYAYQGDTRIALVPGPFSVTRTIPAGQICQYGFLTYGPNTSPGSADSLTGVGVQVDNSDPAITGDPVSQRVIIGSNATFNVTAVGASTLKYHWMRYGTNLVNGGNISGATNASLTIGNAQLADATLYTAVVTDNAGSITSAPARLRVLTPLQYANLLDNPSFELDVVDPLTVPDPWVAFSGAQLQNTNDLYAFTPDANVKTVEGTNVVQVYNAVEYDGIFQDVPASPGQIFTGDGWMYQSSLDPLLAPTNAAFLEVQFRHGNDNPIAIYQSFAVTNGPGFLDTWIYLQATNGIAAGYSSTSTSNSYYLVAPPGTDHVRYQVTLHNLGGGSGSVYVDSMSLRQKIPVQLTATQSGTNIVISFQTQADTSYQTVYKDDLSNTSWTAVGNPIPGDGSVKSAPYGIASTKRFYSVLTK